MLVRVGRKFTAVGVTWMINRPKVNLRPTRASWTTRTNRNAHSLFMRSRN